MPENERDWIYVEDRLPPLNEEVVVKVECDNGLGPVLLNYIDWREQRTGWGRTIECWHKADKMCYTVLAWMPIPEFRRREKADDRH